MRAGGRRHLPATESGPDFTAPFVGVCATVRGSSGWALATGNVPTERRNASRPSQGLARKWNSGAVTFVSSQSKTSGPWMMHMNWPCAEYDGRASSSSLSTSQLCTGAVGGRFCQSQPRMCTAVGAYELAGVPYCIACTPGGSQDTCRSPGVLGGSVGAIRAVRSMPVASRAPRRLHARSSRHARFVTQPGRSAHRTLLCVH